MIQRLKRLKEISFTYPQSTPGKKKNADTLTFLKVIAQNKTKKADLEEQIMLGVFCILH